MITRASVRACVRPVPVLSTAIVSMLTLAPAAWTGGAAAAAQDLETLVREARSDPVTFAFPARPGVCGAGDGILVREPDGTNMFLSGRVSRNGWRSWRDGEPACEEGDVVVTGTRSGSVLRDVRLRVGAPGPDATGIDLGLVTGQEAADYLLAVAGRATEKDAPRLILAAALAADAVRWPALLRLARNRELPRRTRKSALQWLGREAAAEAARELGGIVRDRTEDDEIRDAAVFGLSQLPRDQAVDLLIDVVRTVPDVRVRSRALFWLAEFDDPRAIALFEEILSRG